MKTQQFTQLLNLLKSQDNISINVLLDFYLESYTLGYTDAIDTLASTRGSVSPAILKSQILTKLKQENII